jgi:hypothetical protein
MDFRAKLFTAFLLVIVLVSGSILLINRKDSLTDTTYKPGVSTQVDTAVNQAQLVFQRKKALGVDFSEGPCLTNDLMVGWVVDIVHNPRQPIDNLPQNQCPAYLEGRAKHFIELDTNGNLIRVH